MGKTALITGASRGIGRSIATELGQNGYQVIVNGTKQAFIDEVVSEVLRLGGEAIGYCANVANPLEVTAMVDAVAAKFGCIDVLIHNAGNLRDQKCLRMSDEEWQSVIDVHLNGAFYCVQRVLPHLPEHGGDILMMTSSAGLTGSIGQVNYSAAKAGILGMVWTLAAELQRKRIRVNAISPAALTDMTRPVIEHLKDKYAKRNEPFPEFWQVGDADDVARFISALLKLPDPNLTGEIFGINGTKVTRWQKPEPAFSENGIESFFAAWKQQRGRR
ncbi:SDR family NAD(P)-dependent oxidoreductase [Paenibacillus sp. HJL G12]|uniref:SDR family NAD(P)-dependent oxidoreductase n=1 Tax=Paenibacillus dendrobii TaxID=2691084 RepID=A0A7X3IF63_9BACL|nr:SDR family NAD(P)-dependent oxidoreductase [Paenibacillus dendrobii]MWV42783.1 SDR family NAD(P)-dependent oxidoreductase [Paenibacillus dendrobii]